MLWRSSLRHSASSHDSVSSHNSTPLHNSGPPGDPSTALHPIDGYSADLTSLVDIARLRFTFLLSLVLVVGNAISWAADQSPALAPVDFQSEIQPIFRQHCLKCHGADDPAGGFDLTTAEDALASGAISPTDPAASSMLDRVSSDAPDLRMPPEGPSLTAENIDRLRAWISQGASWPEHWAYRKLQLPEVPIQPGSVSPEWPRNPIDLFIADRLASAGLAPNPPADRLTLLRRASFDLHGLPPSPDEVERFLSDTTPSAWRDCLDRLLNDPAYGERWARHWMDVVHFAETHGHDQDRVREHAWPYRDYLITRFNSDLPYGQFVMEQVAGDVLDPANPRAIEATGFLAAGPWDESSLRDIQENSIDREVGRYLDRDDIVTTVMSTFQSTSVHCARCHDHKFDPISQAEYYGLQAVFAGTDKANRHYDKDPDVARQRTEIVTALTQLGEHSPGPTTSLLTAANLADLAKWEASEGARIVHWQPVSPITFRSTGGATLTKLDDDSLLASGPRPDKDVYVIEADFQGAQPTAVRLDVLDDPSLPVSGPGRQDNGNLHLNEVRVFLREEAEIDSARWIELPLGQPWSDFDQTGWTIAAAVDSNPNSAWGIFPEVSKPHYAVFPLTLPVVTSPANARSENPRGAKSHVRVELHQLHGGGHLIGRLRLSVTDASPETLATNIKVPANIEQLLAIPLDRRSDLQLSELIDWRLNEELKYKLASLPPQSLVYCGTSQFEPDGSFRPSSQPRVVEVLRRGLVGQAIKPATSQSLSCLEGLSGELGIDNPTSEAARRFGLARWLAAHENGLTWRSIVNRVWQSHFGVGLVATPNDFGQMGETPSHPELLEWMAASFRDNGQSLKDLHRLIMSSATYCQSSLAREDGEAVDAGNRLLWRAPRRRLDAESYRDGLLVASGSIDRAMGGPSSRNFDMTPGMHVTPVVDYQAFDVSSPANFRRGVYRFIFRTIPDPFMEALDCPDASQLTPRRNVSLTALQALATLNDKFVVHQSELLAARLQSERSDLNEQISLAYHLLFHRQPTEQETELVMRYAATHGLANACRFLFNTNELLFVD